MAGGIVKQTESGEVRSGLDNGRERLRLGSRSIGSVRAAKASVMPTDTTTALGNQNLNLNLPQIAPRDPFGGAPASRAAATAK